MTIEQKAKAYDKVREKIALRFGTDVAEGIFSEFEESEDERIRKALLEMVHDTTGNELWVDYNVHKEDALAWLEKQGESYTKKDVDDAWLKGMCDAKRELEKQKDTNVFDIPKISIKDAVEVTSRMQYIEDDMKPIAEFIMDYAHWDLHKDEWNQPTLTVPLFRVLDALIQRGKPYCECSQNIEKQCKQKSQHMISAEAKEAMYDKPAWSEEDEKIFNKIIRKLDESDNVSHYDYADFEMWLIDLKEKLINI